MAGIRIEKKLSDKQLYKKALMILEYLELKDFIYELNILSAEKIMNSIKSYDYVSFKKVIKDKIEPIIRKVSFTNKGFTIKEVK